MWSNLKIVAMKIGILTAMSSEHDQIAALLTERRDCMRDKRSYILGRIEKNDIVLLQCGIGKVNAALGTEALISDFYPDSIVSTGCAGGIEKQPGVLGIVAAAETTYHDVWCGEGNVFGQIQGLPARFTANPKLLTIISEIQADSTVKAPIMQGLICTGDRFITDHNELKAIKEKFPDGLAVDMESAAIAQTCYLSEIPFLSLRVISDTPGVEHHWDQYQHFWDEMANRSFEIVRCFLERI